MYRGYDSRCQTIFCRELPFRNIHFNIWTPLPNTLRLDFKSENLHWHLMLCMAQQFTNISIFLFSFPFFSLLPPPPPPQLHSFQFHSVKETYCYHRNCNESCINEWQIVELYIVSEICWRRQISENVRYRVCHGTALEELSGMWFCKCWSRSNVGHLMFRCFVIHCLMFCFSGVVGHMSLYCRQVRQWNRCVVMERQIRGTSTVPCLGWDICAWAELLLIVHLILCLAIFVHLINRIHLRNAVLYSCMEFLISCSCFERERPGYWAVEFEVHKKIHELTEMHNSL